MQDRNSRIVVMTSGGVNPQVMINALAKYFPDLHVVEEQPESKGTLLKRRARRFGWFTALGQLATMVASRLTKSVAASRSADIIRDYGHSAEPNPAIPVTHVASLNDPACHAAVTALNPAAIFTISCRILSPATLAAIPCPVINFHAGINPMYRGQMGGYWSRVEGDEKNFGATVHLVDKGIDTGGTLYENRVDPARSDSLATYPLLITASSVDISVRALRDAIDGTLKPYQPQGPSALRFPPPIWTWVYHGLTRKIW
ncbi:formyl transferase [Neorhizobium galegae]|uniref:Formyl transferase domain protein n=1 Tax=Neorhizobium galegae bv. orientalis str. HAMBI 540 TaxID=1028800 RepID=A0A068SPH6_NEOGA|nr:formyl transferase [Neorhizobium galegae]CDN48207.1 Formyl transferase domain protein [Neorhizobium galegae bv. orientalis str. HAMBI 540]